MGSRNEDEEEFNLDCFLGFTDGIFDKDAPTDGVEKPGFLLVANSTHLKYVAVPESAFLEILGQAEEDFYELTVAEVVAFKQDVRLLAIAEIEGGQPCLITETMSGHLAFFALTVVNEVLELNERNDKGVKVARLNVSYDPIVKIISTIFLCDES